MPRREQRRNGQPSPQRDTSPPHERDRDMSPHNQRAFRFQSFKVKNGVETWAEYKRRLGQALTQQGYEAGVDKKRALLTCSDPELYRLMVSLTYPRVLEDNSVSYEDLIRVLDDQFCEDISEAMAEYLFEARVQKRGEAVADWLADLRQLAIPCNFLEADLSRRIRGQLVRGVADKVCQQKLLEATDLDLKKAVTVIRTHMRMKAESAALNKSQPEAQSSNSNVLFVKSASCYRCGSNHSPNTCWAKDKVCNSCGKRGHIKKMCRGGGKNNKNKQQQQHSKQTVNSVRAAETEQPVQIPAQGNRNPRQVGSQSGEAAAPVAPNRASPQMHHSGQDKGPPVRANQMAAWEQWEYRCNQVNGSRWYPGPDLVALKVDGVPFKVELDNGASTGRMS